jgi:hypothetical protein
MEVRGYFCDVCKKQVGSSTDLRTISIGNAGDHTSYSSYNRYEVYKKYDLCVDCREKIGIILPENKTIEDIRSIESRLYDIVAEIVSICAPQNN